MNTLHNASEEEETTTPEAADQAEETFDVDETESTLGDVLDDAEESGSQTTPDKKGTKGDEKSVPLHVVMDMKDEIKDLKRKLKDKEISSDDFNDQAKDLLEEYSDVDPGFIKKLLSAAKEEARKEFLPEIDKINRTKKIEQQQATLKQLFNKSIASNPEFEDVVNEGVIMQLARDPANNGKTMTQLIEETYGKTLSKGIKSLERPRGSQRNNAPDFANLSSEEEREVLQDPVQRKKYAEYQGKMIKDLL